MNNELTSRMVDAGVDAHLVLAREVVQRLSESAAGKILRAWKALLTRVISPSGKPTSPEDIRSFRDTVREAITNDGHDEALVDCMDAWFAGSWATLVTNRCLGDEISQVVIQDAFGGRQALPDPSAN